MKRTGFFESGLGIRHVHMVGVCGVGMAGLAMLMKDRGWKVTGCDLSGNDLSGWLVEHGIEVMTGHSASHVEEGVDWVIRSRAVSDDCPEITAALKKGIPVSYRGEVLPEILEDYVSVAVSGTHGKTTTSSFITQLLSYAGRDPSWCIGGRVSGAMGVAGVGSRSSGTDNFLVVEADESDGTVELYRPDIAVVTGIEFDHMEHFKDAEAFRHCFAEFASRARKRVVYCGDDEMSSSILKGPLSISYGLGDGCNFRAVNIREEGLGQSFLVRHGGKTLGEVNLPLPGRHNVLNALAAIFVCMELGLSFDEISGGFPGIRLPDRRFQKVVDDSGVKVISDYAHHPSEVRALMDAAQKLERTRLLGIFQPHRYTRTLALGGDFPAAFEGLDDLVLCPVYAASEKKLRGGTVYDLYEKFRLADTRFGGKSPKICDTLEQAWAYTRHILRDGDVLLVIGAGDVEKIAGEAIKEFGKNSVGADFSCLIPEGLLSSSKVVYGAELGKRTTFGVGGSADIWVEAGSVEDLAALMKWADRSALELRIMGAGSNVLVSDMGVRGVVARLSGEEFSSVELDKDNDRVVRVGAGMTISRLLGWLEEKGLGGLEFLEGIPGTTGGALKMNAGAAGHETGERVLWIRCLKKNGEMCIVEAKELSWDYRCCRSIQDMVVVEAALHLDRGDSSVIRRVRQEQAEKRAWMKGARSAGSVFKNPVGASAGELIDRAGLKGRSIGGAEIWERHANFIVAKDGATASDVKALVEFVKAEVRDRFGVDLEEEIVYLG